VFWYLIVKGLKMLEKFDCSVCERSTTLDTDDPLHYTNWKLPEGISKPVCSENCKRVVELEYATARARIYALDQSQSLGRRNKLIRVKKFLATCLLDQSENKDITNIWWTVIDMLDEDDNGD
jgi:hypothetical protein